MLDFVNVNRKMVSRNFDVLTFGLLDDILESATDCAKEFG